MEFLDKLTILADAAKYDAACTSSGLDRPGPDGWVILPVEDFRVGPAGELELAYRQMCRAFYGTIAIEGRYNPKCRMPHIPKRYWAMMTEFQKDWDTALSEGKGIH